MLGLLFLFGYLGGLSLFFFRLRPYLIQAFGPDYLTYILVELRWFKAIDSINNYKRIILKSTITYSSMPLFIAPAMLTWLSNIDIATPLEPLVEAYHAPDQFAGQIAPTQSQRLEQLIGTSGKLSIVIQDTYMEGNHHVSSHNLGRNHPSSQEASLVLDSPILAALREKHCIIISEIQKLHKEGVVAPNS